MEYILVALKDSATLAFQTPAAVRAQGEAIRNFQEAINDPNTRHLHQHPQDFDLYIVGYFDDNTGKIRNLEEPQLVIQGKQLQMAAGFNMTLKGK